VNVWDTISVWVDDINHLETT